MTGDHEDEGTPRKDWSGREIASGIQNLFSFLFWQADKDKTYTEDGWFRDIFRKEDDDDA